jgi:hypothetical protein
MLLHPRGFRRAELIEGIMHGFQDALQAVQRADRRQDVGGISPLRAPGLDPAPGLAGAQEGIQKLLGGLMGEQPVAKIVQQGEAKARVVQVETQGMLPIHAAADGVGRLAIGEPLDVLHDHHER